MIDSDDVCVICLGEADNRSTTDNCDHDFCYSCIQEWCKVKTTCPLCRQQFSLIIHDKKDTRAYSVTFAGIEEAASEINVSQLNAEINDRVRFLSTIITYGEGIIDDYYRLLERMWTFNDNINLINNAHSNSFSHLCDIYLQNVGNISLEIEQQVHEMEMAVSLWEEYRFFFERALRDVANLTSYLNNSSDLAFDPEHTPMSRDDALDSINDVADFVIESRQSYIEFESEAEMFLSDERTCYENTQSKINAEEHSFRQTHSLIAKV